MRIIERLFFFWILFIILGYDKIRIGEDYEKEYKEDFSQ